jgi:tetratricopeptide (TPR) repeat protein
MLTERRTAGRIAAVLVSAIAGAAWTSAAAQGLDPPATSAEPRVLATLAGAATIEARDPQLAAALVRVLAARTPEHLARAGDRYYQLGVRDKAMDYYAEALRRRSDTAAALDGAARIWRDWGAPGPALGSAYRATHAAPRSPAAWNTLGTILQAIGQNAAAARAYTRAIALDDAAVYAHNNLCYLAFTEGDRERALEQCTTALNMDAGFAPARNNLALVYAASGHRDRAAAAFRAAGSEADAHFNMGIVLLAERQYGAAASAFDAASRLEPSFGAARVRAADARRRARAAMETPDANR